MNAGGGSTARSGPAACVRQFLAEATRRGEMIQEGTSSRRPPGLVAACRSGPLGVPAFRLLVMGQFSSTVGDQCYAVALPWFVLSRHGSAAALGAVLACYGIPRALLTIPSGSLADRFGPRLVMLISDVMRCVITAVLAALAAMPAPSLAAVAVAAAALGACSALFLPASMALTPCLVDRRQLTSANALYSGFVQAGSTIGPAIGGILVTATGPALAFAVDAGSYLISAACLARIGRVTAGKVRRWQAAASRMRRLPNRPVVAVSAWTLLRRVRTLQVILVVSVVANFALTGTIEVALPALAHARYGAAGFSSVLTCIAVMSIVGAVGVAWAGPRVVRAALIAAAFQVAAVAIAAAPFLGGQAGLAVGLAVFGLALGFDNAIWRTLIQRWAPHELLCRVWGVLMLAPVISFPLSTFFAGVLTRDIGPAPVFPIAGALLAMTFLYGLSQREFRQLGQAGRTPALIPAQMPATVPLPASPTKPAPTRPAPITSPAPVTRPTPVTSPGPITRPAPVTMPAPATRPVPDNSPGLG